MSTEDRKITSSMESDSPKRKRPESVTSEDNVEGYDRISRRKLPDTAIASTDEDEPEQQHTSSDAVELKIRSIREKMDYFNQHVSGLLEEGKNFFLNAAAEFEKQVMALHQKHVDQWEREIELLRYSDAVNRNLAHRLADSQVAISQLMDHLMTPAVEM
ncbi:hypothetical protein R1flu_023661 [Riccia fluitans]|uniref:Uncharacterized protein n=1 Tax=Riccia fluitans TaxID=41844 RepID=A0ABD1XT65_9MARC